MSRHAFRIAALALALLASSARADSSECQDQFLVVEGFGTPSAELERLAELRPGLVAPASGMLRRGGTTERPLCGVPAGLPWGSRYIRTGEGPAVEGVPFRVLGVYREKTPGGGDDGLLWEGRGFSTIASVGVRAHWGILSAQLAPEVTWSQNDWFQIVNTGQTGNRTFESPYYPGSFDQPQRFGAGPFGRASLGQSYVQVQDYGMQLGFSTENLWWGPGVRTSLMLSNNAEGFPHVYLGTARPVGIGIGTLEVLALWGKVSRSDYYAYSADRYISGLALIYGPRWVPGLYVGISPMVIQPWESLKSDAFLPFLKPPYRSENRPSDNHLYGGWVRWVFPEAGLEIYADWAKDDGASSAVFSRTPDKNSAWNIGMQKLFVVGDRWVRFSGEFSSTSPQDPGTESDYFYAHGDSVDWSNRGQPLGAWYGSGGDNQTLAVDVLTGGGRFGGYIERVRRNDAYFWNHIAFPDRTTEHDAEVGLGLRQVIFAGPLEVNWDAYGGWRENRDFIDREPVLRLSLGVAVPLGKR